jgi:hypothetical protein
MPWPAALLLASLLGTDARAGAWTRGAGEFYAKAGANVYSAYRFVAPGQSEPTDVRYLGQQYAVYAEAGLLPGHKGQLSVSAPLVVGTSRAELTDLLGTVAFRATTVRLGDLRAAAQVALSRKLPISAAIEAKIPLYANGGVGADYPTYAQLFPKPGDGQVDLVGWVYAGASPLPQGFAEVGLGYVHRTEWFVGWDELSRRVAAAQDPASEPGADLSFVDGLAFQAKLGRRFGPALPILGLDGQLALASSPWTRRYVGISASALVDVAQGVAIEPRIATELWAKAASQGIAAGLGLSVRR